MLVYVKMVESQERSWRNDIRKMNLLAGGDPAKVDFLFSTRAGGQSRPGSNVWAISGAHTASHQPLLAGDPHLEFTLPSEWYLVHIRAPRLNVSGASIPGLPGVLIGHNSRIAWSIANLQADNQDVYFEKMDPSTGRYEFHGQIEQARAEAETIRVRGSSPETLVNWVTRHGPVFYSEGGRYYSLRWTAAEAAGFEYPILDLDRAENWEQFRSALARIAEPVLNFVYADAMGNIGSQAAGRLPIRKNFDGSVPVDGSSGDFEWDGFIPFEKLPSVFNPPSGMIVSANQNPFPEDFSYRVNGDFAAPYRARQIVARLKSKQGWRAEEMLPIQMDVYSSFSHFLARATVAACDRQKVSDPGITVAVSLLRDWNGQMQTGAAAPMIVSLVYQHLRTAIANRASPGKGLNYQNMAAAAAVEEILRERPKDWFQDYDQLLVNALRDAITEGRRLQGTEIARWDYGRFNQFVLNNPIVGPLPVIGKYFNIGLVPMGGSQDTVKQFWRDRNIGPSLRMVMDFSDLDRSLANLTLGQSGQVLSRHYKDQWDAYVSGRSLPMQFSKIDAKSTLVFLPERK
jgi:penicillin amidase